MTELSPEALEYVSAWRHILGGWLQWPEGRILRFTDRWQDYLSAPQSSMKWQTFFHDSPIEYVSYLLQPAALRNRSTGPDDDPVEIEHKIEHAVNQDYAYDSASYDWDAARQRVEVVLAEYGASLPTPNDPAWYEVDDPTIERIVAQAAVDFLRTGRCGAIALSATATSLQLAHAAFQQGMIGKARGGNIVEARLLRVLHHTGEKPPSGPKESPEFTVIVLQTDIGRRVLVLKLADGTQKSIWHCLLFDLA